MRDLLAFGHRERQQRRPNPLLRTMVGDVLRRTRLEQRRTLANVAGSARISMQYLSEIERGRKEASSEILAALCAALRLDLSDLLAAVGRDLAAGQRAIPSRVVRLEEFRDGDQRALRTDAPLPAQPATPPDGSLAGEGRAAAPAPGAAAPANGAGAPVCRLAA